MPLNLEQKCAFDAYRTERSVFVTGPAGTGKSFLIDTIVQDAKRCHYNVAVTSMTGVSALLIDGVTLHSYLGIGTGQAMIRQLFPKILKDKRARTRWRTTDVLIIDEVSMMDGTLFDKLENLARMIRESDEFFGGMQLILVGDLFQLPPVKYQSKGLLIHSSAFKAHFVERKDGLVVRLKQIIRQSDPVFTKILMEIREGRVSEDTRNRLGAIQAKSHQEEGKIEPTLLYTHRANVDAINASRLKEIKSEPKEYRATTSICNGPKRTSERQKKFFNDIINARCPAPAVLQLKVGAQVMLTKNLRLKDGLANGSRGVVVGLYDTSALVEFANGCIETIGYAKWDVRIDDNTKVRRHQLPLVLAWATTIHKSQGATLDCVMAELASIFEYGQMYTALSRVRTIEGLSLSGLDVARLPVVGEERKGGLKLAHPDVVRFMNSL